MTARRSRCTVPRSEPLQWRDVIDESHPDVIALTQWLAGLAPFARARAVGELDALLELAAEGQIPYDPAAAADPRAPLVPVRRDPDLYELRVQMLSKKVRRYHAEPASEPDLLVGLHLHVKSSKQQQEEAISQAQLRYRAGEADGWAPEAPTPRPGDLPHTL